MLLQLLGLRLTWAAIVLRSSPPPTCSCLGCPSVHGAEGSLSVAGGPDVLASLHRVSGSGVAVCQADDAGGLHRGHHEQRRIRRVLGALCWPMYAGAEPSRTFMCYFRCFRAAFSNVALIEAEHCYFVRCAVRPLLPQCREAETFHPLQRLNALRIRPSGCHDAPC